MRHFFLEGILFEKRCKPVLPLIESHLPNENVPLSVFDKNVSPQPVFIRPVWTLRLRAADGWILHVETQLSPKKKKKTHQFKARGANESKLPSYHDHDVALVMSVQILDHLRHRGKISIQSEVQIPVHVVDIVPLAFLCTPLIISRMSPRNHADKNRDSQLVQLYLGYAVAPHALDDLQGRTARPVAPATQMVA